MTLVRSFSVKTLMALLALGAFSLPTLSASAYELHIDGPPPGIISTQGHGEIKVKPDSLSLPISVESKESTLAGARKDNNKKAQAIIAALKALEIPGSKLETRYLSVNPIQEAQKGKPPRVVGYEVNNSLEATVTAAAPDKLGEYGSRILDTALNAGANNAGGINFFIDDMSAARTQALALAVKDAQRNADAMAKAANITLTGVFSLEGTPQFSGYSSPRPMMSMRMEKAADAEIPSVPVEAGETTVSSDITARFKF
jgi:uncharacterized protein